MTAKGVRVATLCVGVLFLVALSTKAEAQGADSPASPGRFVLTIVPGPAYDSSASVLGLLKVSYRPQMACWLETPDGRYVESLFVTQIGASREFWGAQLGERPEALPVWYHRTPLRAPVPDAVSTATPAGKTRHVSPLPATPGRGSYVVMLEVNVPFDYNERFTREISGVNGQPSLVYRGEIEVGHGPARSTLAPFGTGSIDGRGGSVTLGTDGMTTALEILDSAIIEYDGK